MPYRRHLSDFMESTTDFTCALVVRTEDNLATLGGGYFSIRKPFTEQQLEKALDDAVQAIAKRGNDALPRNKGQIRAEFALKPKEDTGVGHIVQEYARGKNNIDRGRP